VLFDIDRWSFLEIPALTLRDDRDERFDYPTCALPHAQACWKQTGV
jgi:hypothetical protein